MQRQLLDKRLLHAKNSVDKAMGDNIIERCDNYLVLLNKFRYELYKMRGEFEIDLSNASLIEREKVGNLRKEVREEFTNTMQEMNLTSKLLNRLTAANHYDVVETLNKQNYKGHNSWESVDGSIKFNRLAGSKHLTAQEAISIAIGLRCDAFSLEKTSLN